MMDEEKPAETNQTPAVEGATPTEAPTQPQETPSQDASPAETNAPDKPEPTTAEAQESGEEKTSDSSAKEGAKGKGPRKGKGGSRRRQGGGGGSQQHLREGTIQEIDGEQAVVDLGAAVQGVISVGEFEKPPEIGEKFQFSLESLEGNRWILSRKQALARSMWNELKEGAEVEAKVVGQNSGGLELRVGPIAAFMPSSQVSVEAVSDVTSLFGTTLSCVVLEVNRKRRRLVVSRRAILQKEVDKKRQEAMAHFSEGDVVKGKVARLEAFGAFVDLAEGVTGLLHVSNISRKRIKNPSAVLSLGQEVDVKILELKNGGRRIGLGMKQLEKDPWEGVDQQFRTDSIVTGKVSRITDFGAFVEVAPGVEGLVHISQLGRERIEKVEDATKVGDEFLVRVVSVDVGRQRISLSRLNSGGAVIGFG